MSTPAEPPASYLCPVSLEIMQDPVMTPSGHTYDRATLQRIFADNGTRSTSPMTRAPLRASDLIPNRQLKDAIDEWRKSVMTATANATQLSAHPVVSSRTAPIVERKKLDVSAVAARLPTGYGTSASASAGAGQHNLIVQIKVERTPAPTHIHETASVISSDAAAAMAALASVPAPFASSAPPPPASSAATSIPTPVADTIMTTFPSPGEVAEVDVAEAVKQPRVLAIVIDTSGSMSSPAKEGGDRTEQDGLTRLDLAKHSALTIIEAMDEQDRLLLVSFNSVVRNLCNMELMTSANKARVRSCLNSLNASGGTNMWAGLSTVVQTLSEHPATADSNSAVIFLTDGEPTGMTSDDIVLLFSKAAETTLPFTLHTIGYGYALDSKLLQSLAVLGRGTFSFVPDSSMVVTVFVNLMSYLMSSYVHAATLTLEVPAAAGEVSVRVLGTKDMTPLKSTRDAFRGGAMLFQTQLGRVCVDTSRTLLLEIVGSAPFLETIAQTQMRICITPRGGDSVVTNVLGGTDAFSLDLFRWACCEVATMSAVAADTYSVADAKAYLQDVKFRIQAQEHRLRMLQLPAGTALPADPASVLLSSLNDLLTDLFHSDPDKGQIGKAVTSDAWFHKWGKHYLRAMSVALQQEFTMNYKDLALQHFLGAHGKRKIDALRALFLALPPPTPSVVAEDTNAYTFSSSSSAPAPAPAPTRAPAPAPANMHAYVDNRGGCFDGDGLVAMADSSVKRVRDLVRGDVILSHSEHSKGISWRVRALVTQRVQGGSARMTTVTSSDGNSFFITPYHPMLAATTSQVASASERKSGSESEALQSMSQSQQWTWAFPIDLVQGKASAQDMPIETLFNVVLDTVESTDAKRGFYIVINGNCCATLGHGLIDSPVITHSYFGTDAVLKDLEKIDPVGWNSSSGHVDIPETFLFGRDAATGLVSAIAAKVDSD